ncbi:hypothetical protein PAXINDRAFT_12635 [Paxillus involutus ATCC 200175]|uniref:Uncharacterized protein n=1 Tax=Paxillus involutus ATCC 200175 TaxID=664439 RepID=A0A0C9TFV0_PAXIN|nr:hypothetical protein PAXINDRAFT_12635 [Paxillus involutus ATCC 200175]
MAMAQRALHDGICANSSKRTSTLSNCGLKLKAYVGAGTLGCSETSFSNSRLGLTLKIATKVTRAKYHSESTGTCVPIPRPPNVRVRGLFIENMTLDVLQMLGTKYNIEPFFFSSSANWIPSRYQEDPKHGEGDHITVVLPFIRVMTNRRPIARARGISEQTDITAPVSEKQSESLEENQMIDTQVPLPLPNLATRPTRYPYGPHDDDEYDHLIPPPLRVQRASSKRLHSLLQRTGDSVYWSKIFAKSRDPTFFFLAILWYALYAWDEAFEVLYEYINMLESRVLTTNTLNHTRELHKLQAHLYYYQQLLQDFRKSVAFVHHTPNPAMDAKFVTDQERKTTKDLMEKEVDNLTSEIDRLEGQRTTQTARLKNVMNLAFSTVNIEDSRAMQGLTVASMRDSAAMKQTLDLVSYDGLPSRELPLKCVWHERHRDQSLDHRDHG